jgi:hypothetical protein
MGSLESSKPSTGERALAAIAAVQLGLPEIAPERMEKLARSSLAKSFNPDEPRVPGGNGRESGEWTSGGGVAGVQVAEDDSVQSDTSPDRHAAAVNLRGLGRTYLDAEFADRVAAFDHLAQEGGVTLQYLSGYRTQNYQDTLHTDPQAITPAKLSLHSAGLAVDIDWNSLNAGQQGVVLEAAKQAGLQWGGIFHAQSDPRHFYYDPGGNRQQLIDNFTESLKRLQSGQ